MLYWQTHTVCKLLEPKVKELSKLVYFKVSMSLLKAAKAKRVRSRIQKPFVRFIQAQLDVWNGPLSVQVLYFLFLLPHRRITLIHFYVTAATFMKNIRLLALARNVGIKHATLDTYIYVKKKLRGTFIWDVRKCCSLIPIISVVCLNVYQLLPPRHENSPKCVSSL